ncbi:MAG TPA: preprotein translocase subunit SecE [Fibrobacteres bacterium]|nr:preprotein translocase subunit SecE [Fibrobacterota bacterium]
MWVQVPPGLETARTENWKKRMRRFQNYIRDVIQELRKVTWPTRDELKGATVTVVIFTLISTLFVGVVDFALGYIVKLILG